MRKISVVLLAFLLSISCKDFSNDEIVATQTNSKVGGKIQDKEVQYSKIPGIARMEREHGKASFINHEVVSFDVHILYKYLPKSKCRVIMTTDLNMVCIIDQQYGEVIFYDGDNLWYQGDEEFDFEARFNTLIWPLFFSFPLRAGDKGSEFNLLKSKAEHELFELKYPSHPNNLLADQFHLSIDKQTGLLNYVGFTDNYVAEESNLFDQNTHAIEYSEYTSVNGFTYAQAWIFYNYGKKIDRSKWIGMAVVSDVKFGTLKDYKDRFTKPEKAHKIEKEQ